MSALATARRAVRVVREEHVTLSAAGVAYYAVASFLPLVAVALTALSLLGLTGALVATLRDSLPQGGARVLEYVLTNTSGRRFTGALGAALLAWSASKVFRGLAVAVADIYAAEADRSLLASVARGGVVFALLVGAVALLLVADVALERVRPLVPYPALVTGVAAVLALVVLLLPLYYVLPPTSVTVRHALPGAVLTAFGWLSLRAAFAYYAGTVGGYTAYGLLGSALLFVTFLYFASVVLLVGVAVNVARDGAARGRRAQQPS